jgi:hypothetical protein
LVDISHPFDSSGKRWVKIKNIFEKLIGKERKSKVELKDIDIEKSEKVSKIFAGFEMRFVSLKKISKFGRFCIKSRNSN